MSVIWRFIKIRFECVHSIMPKWGKKCNWYFFLFIFWISTVFLVMFDGSFYENWRAILALNAF